MEELGYNPCYSMVLCPDKYDNLFTTSRYGSKYFGYDHEQMKEFNSTINELIESKELVDCGENEELFLALSAMRDDSDYMQWFICKEEYLGDGLRVVPVGEWQLNVTKDKPTCGPNKLWRKATAEEIINHFNNI